jgi:hypothetical protein
LKCLLTCLTLISFSQAQAEYRVYQYMIKSKNLTAQIESGEAQPFITTLDPQSLLAYHGGTSSLQATLLRTWMCPGYTGQAKPYCPHPGEQTP